MKKIYYMGKPIKCCKCKTNFCVEGLLIGLDGTDIGLCKKCLKDIKKPSTFMKKRFDELGSWAGLIERRHK